ncbi:thioredoxin family protein [Desulfitobacterium sp. AusDCA]|uniref:thioredoxin family protein n=1 Tax=Desulfitobacterium sp. AusDCA TaxID=3240383 RepID=UPI003DA718F7
MNIKILESGCSNCAKMEKAAREAVADLGSPFVRLLMLNITIIIGRLGSAYFAF